MVRHQMVPRIECQTRIVARKRMAPEDKGKQVKRVKREPQKQQAKSYRRSVRLSSKNASATILQDSPTSIQTREQNTKLNQKRSSEDQTLSSSKRPRLSLPSLAIDPPEEEKQHITNWKKIDLTRYWCRNDCWPKEYFRAQPGQIENMSHLLAKKKSTASLRRKNSNSSLATGSNAPTDQELRDGKSAKYRSATYETVLATKGSFMAEFELEVMERSKQICKMLLDEKQMIPEGTIFQNDRFRKACQKLQSKNESRVIQDISRLIVPAAETLATCGAKNLECLVESVNEPWGSSIAFCGPRPQPDYAVGFGRSAFTEDELNKLEPFLGDDPETYSSFFLATFYMYFPFLTSEVKGTTALDIADRQNAHSMTIAVRGVVELFKLVGREEEVNREILAFSISHDHRTVRIYGHYAVIEGNKTSFYRHPIKTFDLTSEEGKDKWSAYKFTKNVYDMWMPDHLRRIQSAIDEIPRGVSFDVSQSELGLSRSNAPFTQQTHVLKRPRRQK
ncbi:conserved hypothetical protein [Coccidioides posadasii str. Silveira]|uniref:DUF7924 domain-containing protein n=1 Tax=Coccidioides posadasii (strain RMSCC 757 / Silveira) TaxID=443226 RepID=E9DB75_COCPS|nr:conserved hypothetical protein [Coccidioides posadasii str. Silveira]